MPRKYGRNTDGTFGKGNAGRPRGSRNKTTRAMESLLHGEGEALTRKAIDLALQGDTVALRLCLDRTLPARRDSPVVFELPHLTDTRDIVQAMSAILNGVAIGDLTPSEASSLTGLVDSFRKAIELTELEARIDALEVKSQ